VTAWTLPTVTSPPTSGRNGAPVATHIEHILTTLSVTSRTAAAVAALRMGLFGPRLLHRGTLSDDNSEQ
jgi:hypothetical protein